MENLHDFWDKDTVISGLFIEKYDIKPHHTSTPNSADSLIHNSHSSTSLSKCSHYLNSVLSSAMSFCNMDGDKSSQ